MDSGDGTEPATCSQCGQTVVYWERSAGDGESQDAICLPCQKMNAQLDGAQNGASGPTP